MVAFVARQRSVFPFSAVVGQDRLKLALILAAIDHALDGVLISGPRGVAKSTLARGLAAIDRRAGGRFVTLPLGATEEQVIGTLDLDKALGDGQVACQPGLIGRAHQGYLYIDEVNLLPDALVDVLLDVAASRTNIIERDGISREHPADFVLVGTMNPDEGALRPQFSDRFGLCVRLDAVLDMAQRQQVVDRRLAYEQDPGGFLRAHAASDEQIADQIESARRLLSEVSCPGALKARIAERCVAAGVEGVRADLHWRQAARAHAAWQGRSEVAGDDVDAVAEFVLCHRRTVPDSEKSASGDNSPGNSTPTAGAAGNENHSDGDWGGLPPRRLAQQQAASVTPDEDWLQAAQEAAPNSASRLAEGRAAPAKRSGAALSGRPGRRINWFRTLTSEAAGRGRRRPSYRASPDRPDRLHCILLDTSASTLGHEGQASARSAVAGIAEHAYNARERLAVLTFGGDRIDWLLQPRRAPRDCARQLSEVPAGGGTPLAEALHTARQQLGQWQRREPGLQTVTWLFTDARCRAEIDGRNWPGVLTVVDTERASVPLGRARKLAGRLGGRYVALDTVLQ